MNASKNVLSVILVVTFVTIASLVSITSSKLCSKKEKFTLPSPRPPNWFLPEPYFVTDWLVNINMERISKPVCLSYNKGDPEILNFNASSYRFYRF